MNGPGEAMCQMATPPAPPSPTMPSSPVPSSKPALSVAKLAEEIFPFVLDRDGYLFECLLWDGVTLLRNRAPDRWRL